MVKNDVQVFGLPRSGTNFIEWSLQNNFKNLSYKNIYTNFNNNQISVKHDLPSFTYSNYVIVIYKEYNLWIASMKKDNKNPSNFPEYKKFLQTSNDLPKNKTIIVEHTWAVKNYFKMLDLISKKFNFELIDNLIQPKYKLNKGGSHSSQTNELFKL